jgi:hypothetical protein
MRSYIPNYSSNSNTTFGLIDNINIFDGIATKVRDYDPYEEYLVVDLAFDGENNSTKIVDNTAWELAPITPLFYPFTDSFYNGTVSGTIQLLDNSSPFNDKSAYFNNSYISHDSSSDFNLTNKDFTIKCWVKFDSNHDNANLYPSIIAKRVSATQWDWGLECNTTNGSNISFVYNNSQFKVLTKNKDDAVRDFMTWCGDTTHYKNVFDETKDCIAPFRGDIPNMKIFLDLHTRDNYDKYTGYLFKSVIIKNNIKEYKFHLF